MERIAANQRLGRLVMAAVDALVLLGAGLAAAWIRFGTAGFPRELDLILEHPGFVAYAVVVQLGLAVTFDLYRPEAWRTNDYLLLRLTALAVSLVVALVIGVYVVGPWRFGRGLLALTLALSLPLQGLLRFFWLTVLARPQARRAVVIGNGPIVGALEEELRRRPSPPFQIVAHLPAPGPEERFDLDTGRLEEADLVIVASLVHEDAVDRLAALNFRGTTVVDAAGAYAALTGRIPVLQVDSRWFIATGDFSSLARSPFHRLQRFLDVLAACALLVLSAPLLLVAALTVVLVDGTPVLYRQVRLGRFGEPFVLLKLRTLRRGADHRGPAFVAPNDHRLLPLGGFLRRWRIDELPQLLNVIRGDMSLVGPRPERPEIATSMERDIPFYAFRYSVRPGLTGWAQVNLPYCTDTEDHIKKLELDLYFLRHYGPAMYAIVLIRTLGALVFRPGQ